MNKNNSDEFVIRTSLGEEKTFYKILTFKSNYTSKSYIIYTDNNLDLDNANIYSSILSYSGNDIKLEKITSDDDFEEVKKALLKVKFGIEYEKFTLSGVIDD